MDTSKEYIKMMEMAWPIIKDDVPIGTILFSRRLRMQYVLDGGIVRCPERVSISDCERAFPLLEQDQLQEMVKPAKKESRARVLELTERFSGYCAVNTISQFSSMEQLWLAFYMKEKYNKVWDGENWKTLE